MEEKGPAVSLIVRTKGRPRLLGNALRSIAGQTYRPLEVVLVGREGSDTVVEGLKEILGDVPLIHVPLENNTGLARAANAGIEHARGRYVGFLADEDELYPDHLTTLVPLLEQMDYRVVYADTRIGHKVYDAKSGEVTLDGREWTSSRDFNYDFLIFENYIPLRSLLFSREVLTEDGAFGMDESLQHYDDWDLLIRIGEENPFFHIKRVTSCSYEWAGDLRIPQEDRDPEFLERAYMRVLSKHRDKITLGRIRGYISEFAEARRSLKELDLSRECLERDLARNDSLIKEKDARIRELDSAVERLESTVRNYQSDSEDLESHLREKGARIAELERILQERETSLRDISATLAAIHNSRGWKALRAYYKVRDRMFPPGSRRRLFVKVGRIAAGDPKSFMKGLSRENIRKFFIQYKTLDPAVVESKVKMKVSLYGASRMTACEAAASPAITGAEEAVLDSEDVLFLPREKNRILVIDRSLPAYDKESGALRMFSLLQTLGELGYRITFVPDDLLNVEPYGSDLEKMGIEVLQGDVDLETFMKKNGCAFSFVILSRPEQTYKHIALIRAFAIHSTIIYDTVDLHWMRFERAGAITADKQYFRKAKEYKAMELFNASAADITFTVTREEKDILRKEIPSLRVEVVPNIHEVSKVHTPFSERAGLMFIGSYPHFPNEDAVLFFVGEILPSLRKKLEGIRFFVVGSDPSPAILRLNSADVIVTGYVKDVAPFFNRCRVFVSPLRYGAGMKGKIGQSMSYGLPVVTTGIGAEGLGLIDGENALVADAPESFADAVVRLYTDETLWNRISKRSTEHIAANYSKAAIRAKVSALFDGIRAAQAG